jgi:hypothetical protein
MCVLFLRTFTPAIGPRARQYDYLISNTPTASALLADRALWVRQPLDAPRMHAALQALLGECDFSAFRAAACQSTTPMRYLESASVRRYGSLLRLRVTANAFLHHMVRNIVGSALQVGLGLEAEGWLGLLLEGRDRTRSGGDRAPAWLVSERRALPREIRHSAGASAAVFPRRHAGLSPRFCYYCALSLDPGTEHSVPTRIKICGVTTPEIATAACASGADALGLVFYAPSKRAVTPERGADIVAALAPLVMSVGLFVDPDPAEVDAVLAVCALDCLQFHGSESAAFCAPSSTTTCAITSAGPRRFTTPSAGAASWAARRSCSSGKTSTTPAPTR